MNDAAATPRVPFGVGDTEFGMKWNFREGRGRAPALTAACYVEIPTGDAKTELGSGSSPLTGTSRRWAGRW